MQLLHQTLQNKSNWLTKCRYRHYDRCRRGKITRKQIRGYQPSDGLLADALHHCCWADDDVGRYDVISDSWRCATASEVAASSFASAGRVAVGDPVTFEDPASNFMSYIDRLDEIMKLTVLNMLKVEVTIVIKYMAFTVDSRLQNRLWDVNRFIHGCTTS